MNIFRRIMARAKNDAGERIESLRFSVPALRVGVLEYGAGQLQTNNTALDGKPVKLYYPPEAVGDKDFLKSLETAPVIVGGHDSTTNEQNKKIDGWAHNVSYDAMKKAAMLDGVVKGAKEVAYIRGNLGSEGFGASAFVDIYNLKVENGVTPDGQEYNAIANELRATHVALAPHVRDPENKIRVTNAVCINTEGATMEVENAVDEDVWYNDILKRVKALKSDDDKHGLEKWLADWKSTTDFSARRSAAKRIEEQLKKVSAKNTVTNSIKRTENMDDELKAFVTNTVRDAVKEGLAAKNAEDEMEALRTKNAELEEKLKGYEGETKNDAFDGKETPEEEKKEKEITAENMKPAQAVVAAFASAFNVDFGAKTPSFALLAGLASIAETDPAKRIAAVNAKYEEIKKTTPKDSAAASNANVSEVF